MEGSRSPIGNVHCWLLRQPTLKVLRVCGMNERLCQETSENVRNRTSYELQHVWKLCWAHFKDIQKEFGLATLEGRDCVLFLQHGAVATALC